MPITNTTYKELIKYIEETGNDDTDCERLEKAFNWYCGCWERCDAFKLGLINELKDQYENHHSDQEPNDLKKLKDIIDGAI